MKIKTPSVTLEDNAHLKVYKIILSQPFFHHQLYPKYIQHN